MCRCANSPRTSNSAKSENPASAISAGELQNWRHRSQRPLTDATICATQPLRDRDRQPLIDPVLRAQHSKSLEHSKKSCSEAVKPGHSQL